MSPATIETTVARHDERLSDAEQAVERIESKLDRLTYGMLGCLATAVISLAVLLFKVHG